MARLAIVAEHRLPREEALRRLETKLGSGVAERYRRQVIEKLIDQQVRAGLVSALD